MHAYCIALQPCTPHQKYYSKYQCIFLNCCMYPNWAVYPTRLYPCMHWNNPVDMILKSCYGHAYSTLRLHSQGANWVIQEPTFTQSLIVFYVRDECRNICSAQNWSAKQISRYNVMSTSSHHDAWQLPPKELVHILLWFCLCLYLV